MSDNEVRSTNHAKRNPKPLPTGQAGEIRNPKRHGVRKQSDPAQKFQVELDELTSDLKRVQADFINYKRRQETEQTQIVEITKHEVIKQLLPIFDNIDRALAHIPKDLANNDWAKGVAQVAKQTEATLAALGIERIQAKGEEFNPQLHEAVSAEGDGAREVVTDELQPGYKSGDYVIRPSMVKVGRKGK